MNSVMEVAVYRRLIQTAITMSNSVRKQLCPLAQ